MRLDTITKIEKFMTDALLSSPQIPLGVNVVSLAATTDEEGIASLARSVTVRYTGSSSNLLQTVPMTIERTLSFDITLAAQSYLTESGHDYAIQMCAGSYNTLNNQVPVNTGSDIHVPLHCTRETFEGLSNSSHYIYIQTWETVIHEVNPVISLDPCVAQGNCNAKFSDNVVSNLLPGDTLDGNLIYVPVLPMPSPGWEDSVEDGAGPGIYPEVPTTGDVTYDPDYCGVLVEGPNLIYKWSQEEVFLENWEDYIFVSTGTFDTSGTYLIVNIYDKQGNFIRDFFAYNCGDKKVIQIGGNMPGQNPWLGGLYLSPIGEVGNPISSGGPEVLKPTLAFKNNRGYVNVLRTFVYADPTSPTSAKTQVEFGKLLYSQDGVELTYEDTLYKYVGGTAIGKGWIRAIDFQMFEYAETLICEEPEIDDDIPEGGGDGFGPIKSCE